MSELLAPAGSMEALIAAIANGADAVYLGMQRFGARAYSNNFDEESLVQAVEYAHLRNVKVYVTMNTIVFEDELPDVYRQLDFLNETGVDGAIAQDLAVLTYIVDHFEDMEAHCSTQMGIDDLEGALLCKELGAKRVVVARETPIEDVKRIRQEAQLPVEAFIHGALCISYSGNCIMSGMTGNRLGNRGRCIGSCRKLYDIVDSSTGELLGRNYILSTKDLCTIDQVDQLEGIDSLKIEGRMKEPIYVANVVSRYRMALDGVASKTDREKLNRTFNRTYTKGYLFHEDRKDITNVEKPNNYGYPIGAVKGYHKGYYELALTRPLRQNDVIRIRHDEEDVNLSVAKLYDASGNLINGSDSRCFIKLKERLSAGDIVYKTKDVAYTKELESQLTGEFRRFPLNFQVHAFPGAPLVVDAESQGIRCSFASDEYLSEAINKPTDAEAVEKQLDRLNDTVFSLGTVEFNGSNVFVPAKMLNAARKALVEQLYAQKLAAKPRRLKTPSAGFDEAQATTESAGAMTGAVAAPTCATEPVQTPYLTASVTTQEQYDACKEAGIDTVWFHNIVPRNGNACDGAAGYPDHAGTLLIGGMGGIQRYRGSNAFVTDYSLNVVNSKSCRIMHQLGAQRVTLSYEVTETQLTDLLSAYRATYGCSPALEMVVYGRAPLLVTKYCPLKKMGQCGTCKTKHYEIQEEYGDFPLLTHANCNTTVLNGKVLNLLDEMPSIEGIEAFRLNFTTEDAAQVERVVNMARAKLTGAEKRSAFNPKTDTRGHWFKEIM